MELKSTDNFSSYFGKRQTDKEINAGKNMTSLAEVICI